MEVTEVRIRKLHTQGATDGGGRMRAVVSVTFDNEFVVHDIKVIQGEQKYFIAMPSRKVEDGTYKDITHPIKSSLRNKLQEIVLARYEQALSEAVQQESAAAESDPASKGSETAGNTETE